MKIFDKNKKIFYNKYMKLDEKNFFNLLYTSIEKGLSVKNVKIHNGKIYKFSLDGKQIETDKNILSSLFDNIKYSDFMKIAKLRFYGEDKILRNGYFSGLVGQDLENMWQWENFTEEEKQNFSMYDIDINKAYLSCLLDELPYGYFYKQKDVAPELRENMIRFYHVKIKSEPNELNFYIPPHPKEEYIDFDFLTHKQIGNGEMVISEIRFNMLRQIYGNNCYKVKDVFFVCKKRYGFLKKFVLDYEIRLEKLKSANVSSEVIDNEKTQAVSLVGMLARNDIKREVDNLLIEDGVIIPQFKREKKECSNYLPISMYVNDLIAYRIFEICKNKDYHKISWHTDGLVFYCDKNIEIENSKKIGEIKSKRIYNPVFFHSNYVGDIRPLIYDREQNKCFNSNVIEMRDDGNFYITLAEHMNTKDGFLYLKNTHKIKVGKIDYDFKIRKQRVMEFLYEQRDFHRLRSSIANRNDNKKKAFAVEENRDIYKGLLRIWNSKHYLTEEENENKKIKKELKGIGW